MYTSAWQSLVMRLRRTSGVRPMASRMLLHFMARLASTLAVGATDLRAARRNSSRHCQIVSCTRRGSLRTRRRVTSSCWCKKAEGVIRRLLHGLQVEPAPVLHGLQVQPAPVLHRLQVQPAPVLIE